MSPSEQEMQALSSIEDGLAGSDPALASMLAIFNKLASGEEMPAREKIRAVCRRAAHRRRTQRQPHQGPVLLQVRRPYLRLSWQQAMLLLWVVIAIGLIALALALNTSGHWACTQPMGIVCSG